ELAGAEAGGLLGGTEDLVEVQERCCFHWCVEPSRLGAEVAVLGAAAGLGRQDALDLDLGPAPGEAYLVGQRGQRGHCVVAQLGEGRQLPDGERPSFLEHRGARRGEKGSAVPHGARTVVILRSGGSNPLAATRGELNPRLQGTRKRRA